MKYKPGGYSWLVVAPESEYEQQIEKLEDKIHILKKEYETTHDPQLLEQIKALEQEIKNKRP